jgi:hypothetical protein
MCFCTFAGITWENFTMIGESDNCNIGYPPLFLLDGKGLNVSRQPEWLVSLPGKIEDVMALPALARLVPLRFFEIMPDGRAQCVQSPVLESGLSELPQDPWETEIQYRRRIKRATEKEKCEILLFKYEQVFSQQIECCVSSMDKTYSMFWVVFPSMPKMNKDLHLKSIKPERQRNILSSLDTYNQNAGFRQLMREGKLDYGNDHNVPDGSLCTASSSKDSWRVLPTLRNRNSLEPKLLGVQPENIGNYKFAPRSLSCNGEGKVGFVVMSSMTI